MADETIIITGGNGFVGKYLLEELRLHREHTKLIVWDRNITGLPIDVTGVEVDITKPETYTKSVQTEQPTWIIHLAAVASVKEALENPAKAQQINAEATDSLFETILKLKPQTKFLAISSADIYGVDSAKPLVELPLSECNPRNPYAQSKLAMEEIIERKYLSSTIRVRPFPHIGPGQKTGFVTADFASQIAAIEAGKQEPVMHVGNLESQRDFTDVRDVVRAYRLLLDKGVMGEVYNVATGKAVKIQTVLDMLLDKAKMEIQIQQDQGRMRPSDTPIVIGDASKLKTLTGWEPAINLETSLEDVLNFWRLQQA